VATAVAGLVFIAVAAAGIHKTPAWAGWNFSGYEAKCGRSVTGECLSDSDYWAEYSGLMAAIDRLPPGRVMWEYTRDMDRYGTPMALMLTAYWSEGHPSMEGLFFESSLTTPFHFLNQSEMSQRPSNPVRGLDYRGFDLERGLAHMQVYNVAYYVTFTEEATEAARGLGLEQLDDPPPFTIFRLPQSSLVEVAAFEPAVWDGDDSFRDASLAWYDDITHLDRWLVEDGPGEWLRVDAVSEVVRRPLLEAGEVSDIAQGQHTISFSTTAVGVPHLVKVSYFPNWKARGADGPYWAAPSLMVVVPTEEDVVIEFGNTWAETTGMALSGVGLLGIGGFWLLARRRRKTEVVS
jgi:hypothetical protein